jgi:hypothetical protein
MPPEDTNSAAPLLAYHSQQRQVEVCAEPGRLTILLPPSPMPREITITCVTALFLGLLSFLFATPLTLHWFSRRVYTFELIATPFSIIFAILLLDALLRIYRMARRSPEPASIVIDDAHISISSTHHGARFFRSWPRHEIASVDVQFHLDSAALCLRITWMSGNWVLLKHKLPNSAIPFDLQDAINTHLPPRTPHRTFEEFNFERWI